MTLAMIVVFSGSCRGHEQNTLLAAPYPLPKRLNRLDLIRPQLRCRSVEERGAGGEEREGRHQNGGGLPPTIGGLRPIVFSLALNSELLTRFSAGRSGSDSIVS